MTQPPTTLAQRKRALTVDALVQAAQQLMSEQGLDVTVEGIAELAGVGRRTAFRYFVTREDLLSDAVTGRFAELLRSVPPYGGGDWQVWVADLSLAMHRTTADGGRGIWELKTRRLPPRLALTYQQQRRALQQVFTDTAITLWGAAGGGGDPPDELERTLAVFLSPLFNQTVLLDAQGGPAFAGRLAADAIIATVCRLLGEASDDGAQSSRVGA